MNTGDKITVAVIAVLVFVVIVFYVLGSFLSFGKVCYNIGETDCEHCYTPCMGQEDCNEEKREHNAIVDTLMCACEDASKNDYTNTYLNDQIVKFFNRRVSSFSADSVQDVCENNVLVKWE